MKDAGRYTGCRRNTLTLRAQAEEAIISTVAFFVKPIYKNRMAIRQFFIDVAMFALFCLMVYVIYIKVEYHPRWSIFMALITGGLALRYVERKEF